MSNHFVLLSALFCLTVVTSTATGDGDVETGQRYVSADNASCKSRSLGYVKVNASDGTPLPMYLFDPVVAPGQTNQSYNTGNTSATSTIILPHPFPASTQVAKGEARVGNILEPQSVGATSSSGVIGAMAGEGAEGLGSTNSNCSYDLFVEPVQGDVGKTRFIYQKMMVHTGCRANLESNITGQAKVDCYCGWMVSNLERITLPGFGTIFLGRNTGEYYENGQKKPYDSYLDVSVIGIRSYVVPAARQKLNTDKMESIFKGALALDTFAGANCFGSAFGGVETTTNTVEQGAGPVNGGGSGDGSGGGTIGD